MTKYYDVFQQPFLPIWEGKFTETAFDTFEEAEAEAERISTENPLIITYVLECENGEATVLKEICKVRIESGDDEPKRKKGNKRK